MRELYVPRPAPIGLIQLKPGELFILAGLQGPAIMMKTAKRDVDNAIVVDSLKTANGNGREMTYQHYTKVHRIHIVDHDYHIVP